MVLPAQALLEADVARIAHDDVIEQVDIKQPSGGYELLRHLDILRAWRRVPGGMVVCHNDVWTIAHNRRAKDLRGAQHRTVDRTHIAPDALDHLVLCV